MERTSPLVKDDPLMRLFYSGVIKAWPGLLHCDSIVPSRIRKLHKKIINHPEILQLLSLMKVATGEICSFGLFMIFIPNNFGKGEANRKSFYSTT